MTARTCIDCEGSVGRHSRSGRCRTCSLARLNADPEFQAKRKARLAAVVATPGYRAKHREGAKRGAAKRVADPEQLKHLRRICSNVQRERSPEVRAVVGQKVRAYYLAWCPSEYWEMNRLLKANGYRLAERKAMIADEAKRAARRDAEAAEASLTPFERQMAKVAAGAKLIEKPVFRQADPTMTLGGVATGLL